MNITITITNPTVNVLAALAEAHAADNAKMMESLDKASSALDVLLDEVNKHKAQTTPAEDTGLTPAQVEAAQYDPQDTALRIASVADIDDYLDVGSEVHWHGTKFVFDGVVEKINDNFFDTEGEEAWTDTAKVLFIRRNDTDKLVSLTLRDLQTGSLTLID